MADKDEENDSKADDALTDKDRKEIKEIERLGKRAWHVYHGRLNRDKN
jgi:hypothetical protein